MTCFYFAEVARFGRHRRQIGLPGGEKDAADQDCAPPVIARFHEKLVCHRSMSNSWRVRRTKQWNRVCRKTVCGDIHPPASLVLQTREVAGSFLVPLDHFVFPDNHYETCMDSASGELPVHVFIWKRDVIWGVDGRYSVFVVTCALRTIRSTRHTIEIAAVAIAQWVAE